jgi:hypothetical protein
MSALFTYPFIIENDLNPIINNNNVNNVLLDSGNLAFPLQVADDDFGNVLIVQTNSTSTTPDNATSYFALSFNVKPNYSCNITSLTFNVGKGGAADPRGYVIKSNRDNYQSVLGGAELPTGPQQPPQPTTINISSLNNLQQLTLRFYVYTPGEGRSVDFNNVSVNGIIQPQPQPQQISMRQIIGSIYSDNARVYYKPHSLAACGVGTVKNARHTAKKT